MSRMRFQTISPDHPRYKGKGMKILYGFHKTPVGEILTGETEDGLCWLGFTVDGRRDAPLDRMKKHFPRATYEQDNEATTETAHSVVEVWQDKGNSVLTLDLHGTDFHLQVWKALTDIPAGKTESYSDLARRVGRPKSARATGNAVGNNPVSLLVPCHRILKADGAIGNYGWGPERKKIILAAEK